LFTTFPFVADKGAVSETKLQNEATLRQLVATVPGSYLTSVDSALGMLSGVRARTVKQVGSQAITALLLIKLTATLMAQTTKYRGDLSIGPDVKIGVYTYGLTAVARPASFKKMAAAGAVSLRANAVHLIVHDAGLLSGR
jgi:hypothetical protein